MYLQKDNCNFSVKLHESTFWLQMFCGNICAMFPNIVIVLIFCIPYKLWVIVKQETKRNETDQNETNRRETRGNRNETKQNQWKIICLSL